MRQAVYSAIYELTNQNPGVGGTVEDILQLASECTDEQVRKEINDFLSEGLIVTTTDDSHYALPQQQ